MLGDRRLWIWDSLGKSAYYQEEEFRSFTKLLERRWWKVVFNHCKPQVEQECAVATLQNAEALMVHAMLGPIHWDTVNVEVLQDPMTNTNARQILAKFLAEIHPKCENWFDVVMGMTPSGCF